jgi:hypothetical protein
MISNQYRQFEYHFGGELRSTMSPWTFWHAGDKPTYEWAIKAEVGEERPLSSGGVLRRIA